MVPLNDHRKGAPAAEGEDEVLPPTIRKKARARKDCGLTSVRSLVAKVEDKAHEGLKELMRDHAFVGSATDTLALVQHGTRLFLVDLPQLTKEAVYQACLRRC
jgi:DNA mismatch repair protein MLH1